MRFALAPRTRIPKLLLTNLALLLALGCASHDSSENAAAANAADTSAKAVSASSVSPGSQGPVTAANADEMADTSKTAAAANSASKTSKAQTITEGPITGFGSVIVNQVRYNDNGAVIENEDDELRLTRADLRLGTIVRVTAGTDALGTRAAHKIAVLPALRGRIDSIDSANNSLLILNQTVLTDANTLFEGSSASKPLQIGDWVEVHGIASNQVIIATLIERKSGSNQAMLRGTVSNHNPAAKTFNLGALTVSYASAQLRPEAVTLTDGSEVSVRAKSQAQNGQLIASKIRVRQSGAALQGEAESVEFSGIVESQADAGGLFKVSGVKVLVVSNEFVPKGGYVIGQQLKLKGSYRNDVLVAEEVQLDGPMVNQNTVRNRLIGTVATRVGKNFSVNGIAVDASQALVEGGALETLLDGAHVEVSGSAVHSEQGTVVSAAKVVIAARPVKGDAQASDKPQHLYGAIHGFVSASQFSLNGTSVDASGAQFMGGDIGRLANDVYVEIRSTMNNSILIASEVRFSKARRTKVESAVAGH